MLYIGRCSHIWTILCFEIHFVSLTVIKDSYVFEVAAFPMLKLKQEYADHLHNNKGAFCLNKACVGLAGNQAGFVEMSLGTYKNDELANLPSEKHMAKHGMICFGGICAGIDEDMPYMMFHGLSQDNPDSNVIGIKEENGFICLEGSCVHFTGNPNDGTNIMKQFNKNGVKMAHAEFVGIFLELCSKT